MIGKLAKVLRARYNSYREKIRFTTVATARVTLTEEWVWGSRNTFKTLVILQENGYGVRRVLSDVEDLEDTAPFKEWLGGGSIASLVQNTNAALLA